MQNPGYQHGRGLVQHVLSPVDFPGAVIQLDHHRALRIKRYTLDGSVMDVDALIGSWKARREETEKRFREHFPELDDMLAIVLRGHLLVEEFLDRLNRHCFHYPEYYDRAGLNFHRKLMIARAQVLVPHSNPDHFFDPIAKLNELRCAHLRSACRRWVSRLWNPICRRGLMHSFADDPLLIPSLLVVAALSERLSVAMSLTSIP